MSTSNAGDLDRKSCWAYEFLNFLGRKHEKSSASSSPLCQRLPEDSRLVSSSLLQAPSGADKHRIYGSWNGTRKRKNVWSLPSDEVFGRGKEKEEAKKRQGRDKKRNKRKEMERKWEGQFVGFVQEGR